MRINKNGSLICVYKLAVDLRSYATLLNRIGGVFLAESTVQLIICRCLKGTNFL